MFPWLFFTEISILFFSYVSKLMLCNCQFAFFQYFATVETPSSDSKDAVQWLPISIIEPSPQKVTDAPDMVGSGESVGGVVTDTVGASSEDMAKESVQLQRIASRCNCQFYYASYGGEVNQSVAAEMLQSASDQVMYLPLLKGKNILNKDILRT